jgi:hypothetical protein
LFHGTGFIAFSPLRNDSERNSESFLFCGTAGIPPEQTNCSVYSVFRGIFFLSEIVNPRTEEDGGMCDTNLGSLFQLSLDGTAQYPDATGRKGEQGDCPFSLLEFLLWFEELPDIEARLLDDTRSYYKKHYRQTP